MKDKINFTQEETEQLKQYLHAIDNYKDAIDELVQSCFVLLENAKDR